MFTQRRKEVTTVNRFWELYTIWDNLLFISTDHKNHNNLRSISLADKKKHADYYDFYDKLRSSLLCPPKYIVT